MTSHDKPCACWIGPVVLHEGCCFGYRDDDAYQRGQPPPCGHWVDLEDSNGVNG